VCAKWTPWRGVGGDEFVVLLSYLNVDKVKSASQAGIVAEEIRIVLSEPYLLTISHDEKEGATIEHHCTASIGVVVFINHEGRQNDLLQWADTAMYEAKEAGRNSIRFYDLNVGADAKLTQAAGIH
jgi:diguanylate cyclase (GGDEF)-like protein